jgi:hypothetical protein
VVNVGFAARISSGAHDSPLNAGATVTYGEYNNYKPVGSSAVARSVALRFLHTIKHTSKVKPIENIWIKLGMGPGPVHARYKYLKKNL